MRFLIPLLLLALGLAACTAVPEADNGYNLYLVRHAEKVPDGTRDPLLTGTGKQRAEQLATWFLDKDIRDIWSSDFNRTRDTAGPSLSGTGLELRIYDPAELLALSENLLKERHNAIIVGHSDTTPELARLLCRCAIDDMDDSEYGRLIVISVTGAVTQVKTLRQDRLSQR